MTSRLERGRDGRYGRRFHAWLLPAYLLFVWYGSLVPLNFDPLPLDDALSRYRAAVWSSWSIYSHTDFAANILLFVPLGYFLMGALRSDRRSRRADLLAGLIAIPGFSLLSMTIEFTEMYFPGRTLSFIDVVAQTIGGTAGIVLWLWVGRAVTAWMRDFAAESQRAALVVRLLLAYVVCFAVAQLAPLDLTLDLGQLAAKYRAGRIVLIPFSYEYASWTAMVWDHLWDVLLNAPLGAAAVLLGRPAEGRRTAAAAFALAAVGVAALEGGQVLVVSRIADVTDVIKGSLGAALGVVVASRTSQTGPDLAPATGDRLVVLARLALVTWAIALIGYHWNPFQFSFDRERVHLGLRQISQLPLAHHFWSQEFHAFTEMLRKAMLALPLGTLLYFSWPDRGRPYVPKLRALFAMVGGFALLLAIELGQVFLPSRLPDITDVLLGTAGILVGLWLAGRLARTAA